MDHAVQVSEWIEWATTNRGYLHDKILVKKAYPTNAAHTHCELCWARFGSCDDDLKQGYFEQESESWICMDCYSVFQERFHWRTDL